MGHRHVGISVIAGALAAVLLAAPMAWAGASEDDPEDEIRVPTPLDQCPETEPASVMFDIDLVWPVDTSEKDSNRSRRALYHPKLVAFDVKGNFYYGIAHVMVRGRLRGGPEREFELL